MDLIKACEAEQLKDDITDFNIGDTVKIHYKIIEGKNERIQVFEGLCIAKKNTGIRKTFTIRKISYGVGVERTFPLHSPKIANIEVVRLGRVRRAKLYYIRSRVGKAAKVKEFIRKKEKKVTKSPAAKVTKKAAEPAASQQTVVEEVKKNEVNKTEVKKTEVKKTEANRAEAKKTAVKPTEAKKEETKKPEVTKTQVKEQPPVQEKETTGTDASA
jgi:large subunit ribosomal protein L19